MRSTFKVLFYVKKGSEKPNGNLPLMCRLTVDGEVKQFSCKTDVPLRLWDVKNNRASGKSAEAHMIVLKHIISIARNTGVLPFNPFAGYINSPEHVDRGYLTEEEIQTLIEAPMKNKTYELVRDLFVFSIFTGLSYADVKNLTTDNLQTFFDGNLWIITRRKKTNTDSNIRLLDVPKWIIEKYKGLAKGNLVFPVPSNSCCNQKLKKIGEQCGIKPRMTYHVSRHSAATTILLSHGVPIETVSRILGHTNIKTTQIYAKITNQKISRDMETLSQKLEGMEKSICDAI